MIEQTELIVDEWIYRLPVGFDPAGKIDSELTLEVMKKTAPGKKGLACRFTGKFVSGNDTLLLYVAQDSYVIDEADKIEAADVHTMLRNSYSKFKEKYEFRKLGTVLQDTPLTGFDETKQDIREILSLLN